MKKVFLVVVVILTAASALATPPSRILVKYDVHNGYGRAIINALKAKWSSATIMSFRGDNWPSFNYALTTGTWNMVIVEAHNYRSINVSYFTNLANWYNKKTGPLFYANWDGFSTHDNVLETAMGAGNPGPMPMPPKPHYAWVATHPICSGVTDWTYGNPGYNTGGESYPWTTASPVTGWAIRLTPGQGGIMVANDKYSVISGYFPSLNTSQGQKLWENILGFMWSGYSIAVAPQSLGKIKSLYK